MATDDDRDSFEDMLRAVAQELTQSFDRISEVDVEAWTRRAGLDPGRGLEWLQTAREWVQQQAEGTTGPIDDTAPPAGATAAGPAPHPLDLPTDEQGAALAALDSGRWALEPGTMALTVIGDGPGPTDALGLVRSLRVRDWLRADGTPTLAGHRALERWLAATA
jgi:hypothetical protein